MEQQEEEKKRETCRITKLTSTTSLPQELTSEILLRLPARSVLRFCCVSKLWLAITTDPYSINLFQTLLPSLLVCFKEGDKLFVSSIPQHQNLNESSQPIYRYHMELPNIRDLPPTESVHGLICFQNPGSGQETWRTVKTNHKHRSDYYTSGRCIKGVIYYQAYDIYHLCVLVIMSFDIRSEKCDRIDLPSDIRRDMLIKYEGKLAGVDITRKRTLWILEDGEKHKWSSKDFLERFALCDESLGIHLELNGFTHAGELIYVPFMFNKSHYVVFFDPVRRSYRRFDFKGITFTYDESRPSRGVRNGSCSYSLHTFPNHI